MGYDANALSALEGSWPNEEPFIFGPLYSFFLFIVYAIFGVNYVIPLIIHMMLGSVIVCAAIYWIGKYVFSHLTGLLAALAVALYGPLIVYGVCYTQVSVTVPLFVLIFFFLLKFFDTHQNRYILLSGLAMGLCALSRPTVLVVVPIIIIFLILEIRPLSHLALSSGFFIFALAITILPFTVHNYRVTGRVIPISDNGEINLYLGNNWYSSAIGPIGIASQYSHKLGNLFYFPGELDEVVNKVKSGQTSYIEQVKTYVLEHPWDWLELMTKKMHLIFLEPDWKLIPQYAGQLISLKGILKLQLIPIEWMALMIFGTLSAYLMRNKFTTLIFLSSISLALVTSLFFVQFRFRLPIAPFLLLLAAGLVIESKNWGRGAPNKFIAVFILLLLIFPFVPSILFFIILFSMIGLFAGKGFKQFQWVILFGLVYVVVVGFGLSMKTVYNETSQEQDYFVGPAIWGDIIVGQTISPSCNGLNQIQVELSRLSSNPQAVYNFHLVPGLELDKKIYSTKFDTKDIGKWTYKRFDFPPIWDSKGKSYFFFVESPDTHPEDSIAVRLNGDLPNSYGQYNKGNVYGGNADNLLSFPADLVFVARCNESYLQLAQRTINYLFGIR